MYQMIGGDEREYGPLTAEQLREFIAAGRANGETRIKKEGETEWRPLASYPEFSDPLAAKSSASPLLSGPAPDSGATSGLPLASPTLPSGLTDPDALAADALARNYQISIGLSFGRAWDLLKSDFWPIIGVSALVLIIMSVAGAVYLHGPLLGGLFAYYLKRIRGQSAELADAFSGFTGKFLPLFLGGLVSSLLSSIGLLFCLVPGIYLAVAWLFLYPIVMDRNIGFWEAMEVSRKVLTKHWWGMFLLLLVSLVFNMGGALLCGIGTFVTIPLGMLAVAYVYEDLFGVPK
jgi:hypothetical protein